MVSFQNNVPERQLIYMAPRSSRTMRQFWLQETFRACFFFYYLILLKWVTYWRFNMFSHALAVPKLFRTSNMQNNAPFPLTALSWQCLWMWGESFAQRENGVQTAASEDVSSQFTAESWEYTGVWKGMMGSWDCFMKLYAFCVPYREKVRYNTWEILAGHAVLLQKEKAATLSFCSSNLQQMFTHHRSHWTEFLGNSVIFSQKQQVLSRQVLKVLSALLLNANSQKKKKRWAGSLI